MVSFYILNGIINVEGVFILFNLFKKKKKVYDAYKNVDLQNLIYSKEFSTYTGTTFLEKFNMDCDVTFDGDVTEEYVNLCINYLKNISDHFFKQICDCLIEEWAECWEGYSEEELASWNEEEGFTDEFFPSKTKEKDVLKYVDCLEIIINKHPNPNIIGFCLCGNCDWDEEHGFIIVINDNKIVYCGEQDNIYYPWEEDERSKKND